MRGLMDCSWFREHYSDFADGLLTEADEIEVRHHLARCQACGRFDGAFRLGVGALRHLPEISASRDFQRQLAARLVRERPLGRTWRVQASGVAASLCLVAFVGVVVRAGGAPSVADGTPLPVPASSVPGPFAVPAADDSTVTYPHHFPVIPVSRDPRVTPATPAISFAIAADWIAP
jgi:predicted anti-sigma-YlaC factor YlaD